MATKKDAPKDAPDAFERKPTTARARRRNPVTEVDVVFGGQLKQARNSTGLSLRDTAERMANPDGTPHYLVSATLERIAEEGPSKDLNAQLGKAPAAARDSGAGDHAQRGAGLLRGHRHRHRHPAAGRRVQPAAAVHRGEHHGRPAAR